MEQARERERARKRLTTGSGLNLAKVRRQELHFDLSQMHVRGPSAGTNILSSQMGWQEKIRSGITWTQTSSPIWKTSFMLD